MNPCSLRPEKSTTRFGRWRQPSSKPVNTHAEYRRIGASAPLYICGYGDPDCDLWHPCRDPDAGQAIRCGFPARRIKARQGAPSAAIASLPRADRWPRASPGNPRGTWGGVRDFRERKFEICAPAPKVSTKKELRRRTSVIVESPSSAGFLPRGAGKSRGAIRH
jgi:hypothetical protein